MEQLSLIAKILSIIVPQKLAEFTLKVVPYFVFLVQEPFCPDARATFLAWQRDTVFKKDSETESELGLSLKPVNSYWFVLDSCLFVVSLGYIPIQLSSFKYVEL